MTQKVDRFKNPIEVGSVVAYAGTVVGLIIGVVVKMNPMSFKIKYTGTNWRDETEQFYINVPFSSNGSILTIKSFEDFDKLSLLDDIEKLRLGLSQ